MKPSLSARWLAHAATVALTTLCTSTFAHAADFTRRVAGNASANVRHCDGIK